MPQSVIFKNASQIVTVCDQKQRVLTGDAMKTLTIVENGTMAVHEGEIIAIGTITEVEAAIAAQGLTLSQFSSVDCTGQSLIPGLVDAHTHPVFAGDRVHEFAMKLAGATYMDIHKIGGGIGFTVNATRAASESELLAALLDRLDSMVRNGSTTIECKSGYGLDTATELKMLRVLHQSRAVHPVDTVHSYLAHSVPKDLEGGSAEMTRLVVEEQIPAIVSAMEVGEATPTLVDVFCEKGVFNHDESEKILKAGLDAGLKINFHGDELTNTASAELGAGLGALGISHLECVSKEGAAAMAEAGTVGVLLPTTAYILRIEQPPARDLIEAGVPVALATDFNPNVPCPSLPFVMHLGCVAMHMTLEETLAAVTINAAAALGVSGRVGSLEVGKAGDVVVVDAPKWEHLVYNLANPTIAAVYKDGDEIYRSAPGVSRK